MLLPHDQKSQTRMATSYKHFGEFLKRDHGELRDLLDEFFPDLGAQGIPGRGRARPHYREGNGHELCGILLQDGKLDWPCRSKPALKG
jgi:hypothetical protein